MEIQLTPRCFGGGVQVNGLSNIPFLILKEKANQYKKL